MTMMRKPTLMEFVNYEIVRRNGKFNMIMEGQQAAEAAGLDVSKYINVMNNYEWCMNEWKNKRFKIKESWIGEAGMLYAQYLQVDDLDAIFNLDEALDVLNNSRVDVPEEKWELEVV